MPPAVAEIPHPPSAVVEQEPDRSQDDIVDIDTFEYKEILKQPTTSSVSACEGYAMIFPDGKSPHTTYPFTLHDMIVIPWDYALKNGMMKLFV